MTTEFTPQNLERFHKIVAKYEQAASALMPALYLAQEQFGFLTPPVLEYVASLLKIPAARAFEASSFYTMYRKRDMGKWCLQVCNNVTCTMMGSEEILAVIKEELGINPNENTEDNEFSLLKVECLGSCDTAPVVQVNDDYCENLTPKKMRDLIKRLKQDERPRQGEANL
jgi:NADH dehydrogenase (ubiquinone) flavoprotein 2